MADTYVIVLDTNTLGDYKNKDKRLDENSLVCKNFKYLSVNKDCFLGLIKFVQEGTISENIKIAVPKIVLEELKEQQIRDFNKQTDILNAVFAKFSELDDYSLNENRFLNFSDLLDNTTNSFVRTNNLIVINYPDNEILPKLINKAVKKYKPFYKKKNQTSDSGFKDSILWESLLKYAKDNNDKKYILFTNDGDFKDEHLLKEFEAEVGSSLEIKETLAEVKSFVEEVINENMDLKQIIGMYQHNYEQLHIILKKYFRYISIDSEPAQIFDFQLNPEISDIQKDNDKYVLLIGVNITYKSNQKIYNPFNNEYTNVEQAVFSDEMRVYLTKEGSDYKITDINFQSEKGIRLEAIQETLIGVQN